MLPESVTPTNSTNPKNRQPIRVALIDDQLSFLDHSSEILNAHSGFDIVGTALDGQEALQALPELEPDVAIIDVAMPELNGFATALRLIRNIPKLKVIMVSEVEDKNYVILAEDVGALGFISKQNFSAAELLKLVETKDSEQS